MSTFTLKLPEPPENMKWMLASIENPFEFYDVESLNPLILVKDKKIDPKFIHESNIRTYTHGDVPIGRPRKIKEEDLTLEQRRKRQWNEKNKEKLRHYTKARREAAKKAQVNESIGK